MLDSFLTFTITRSKDPSQHLRLFFLPSYSEDPWPSQSQSPFLPCSVLARSSTLLLYFDKLRRNHTLKYLQLEGKQLQPYSLMENIVDFKSSGKHYLKNTNKKLHTSCGSALGKIFGGFKSERSLCNSWLQPRNCWRAQLHRENIPLGVVQDCLMHCTVNIIWDI